ncbi:unnamed protein product [Linum tenue]|uniref:Uncharacterized protein n=1 Tax=Linum tenue TaxID=586396 RepID=A0AAV0LRB7_9ROSI|nr:unnamed protein product [Linum tenue]
MENQILSIVAGGVACWTAAFILARNMFPKRSLEFCNRLVSTLHAILGVTLASLTVADWRRPVSPVAADSSPRQMQTLANAVHHLVSIVGIGAGLAYQKVTQLSKSHLFSVWSFGFLLKQRILKGGSFRCSSSRSGKF